MLAIQENKFIQHLTIAQDPSIIFSISQKHDELNLVNFTKNRQPTNLNPVHLFMYYKKV